MEILFISEKYDNKFQLTHAIPFNKNEIPIDLY